MTDYVTVKDYQSETVIKKSRFITFVYAINDGADAEEKLAYLRKKYYDSTHVCYAYVADEIGNEMRYSDDGEPSGTAGQPILDALKKSGLKKTLVAVVRYFGGTLLGAGGLVRAYSSCCSTSLSQSEKVKYSYRDIYEMEFDFSTYKKISNSLAKNAKVIGVEYGACVKVTLATEIGQSPKQMLDNLCSANTNPVFMQSKYLTEKTNE